MEKVTPPAKPGPRLSLKDIMESAGRTAMMKATTDMDTASEHPEGKVRKFLNYFTQDDKRKLARDLFRSTPKEVSPAGVQKSPETHSELRRMEKPVINKSEALALASKERDAGNFAKAEDILKEKEINPGYRWYLDTALQKEEKLKEKEAASAQRIEVDIKDDPMQDYKKAQMEVAYSSGKDPIADLNGAVECADVFSKLQGKYPDYFEDSMEELEENFNAFVGPNPELQRDPEWVTAFGEALIKGYLVLGKPEKVQEIVSKLPQKILSKN